MKASVYSGVSKAPLRQTLAAMSTRGTRIRHVRKINNLTQAEFADLLRVTPGAVGNWERDKGITTENLGTIAAHFGVNMDWLQAGRGAAPTESHIRKKPGPISVRYVTGVRQHSQSPVQSFDPDEKPIAALHSGGRHNVPAGEIPQIAARLGLGHAADADTIQIPMGGGSVMALPVIDTWKIPESVLRRRLQGAVENVHIVECVGDSMEPRIRDGDFVFIDASAKTPHPPGIFAISETLGPTLKRLEVIERTDPVKVRVIPENPRHSTYEVMLEEITIIGRYLCRLTME